MSRVIAIILAVVNGLSAVVAGTMLAIAPDGRLLGMRTELLRYDLFGSFLVPGLLLALVVGGSSLVAAALLLLRRPGSWFATAFAGAALTIWIVVQMMLVPFDVLQVVFGSVGLILFAIGFASWRRTRTIIAPAA